MVALAGEKDFKIKIKAIIPPVPRIYNTVKKILIAEIIRGERSQGTGEKPTSSRIKIKTSLNLTRLSKFKH